MNQTASPGELNPDNVLHALSLLLYPDLREEGLARLQGLGALDEACAASLRAALADGAYLDRNLFQSLAPIKLQLDAWSRRDAFCLMRPTIGLDYIGAYRKSWPDAFTPFALRGKDVMDFGAGKFNPLAVAILLYVNGARSVVAFDPGGWRIDYVQASVRELVGDIISSPRAYNIGYPGDPKALVRRLGEIGLEALGPRPFLDLGPIQLRRAFSFDEYPSAFDLILSTSVLEHVRSFDTEIANHLRVLRKGGVSINRVDFTDHRHAQPDRCPFGFYEDGDPAGCNHLRVSDLTEAAGRLSARCELRDVVLAEDATLDRLRLLERFRGYSRESLRTMAATFVLFA